MEQTTVELVVGVVCTILDIEGKVAGNTPVELCTEAEVGRELAAAGGGHARPVESDTGDTIEIQCAWLLTEHVEHVEHSVARTGGILEALLVACIGIIYLGVAALDTDTGRNQRSDMTSDIKAEKRRGEMSHYRCVRELDDTMEVDKPTGAECASTTARLVFLVATLCVGRHGCKYSCQCNNKYFFHR